jgi:hypothetical protein
MLNSWILKTAFVAMLGAFAAFANAQTWDETTQGGGDAAQTVAGTQTVSGAGPLTTITGGLSVAADVDLYLIRISNSTTFAVDTTGSAQGDTKLYLFHPTGMGIAMNEDTASSNFLASFPAGNALYNTLPAGNYILGVTGWSKVANSAGGFIFNPESTTTAALTGVQSPTGAGGGQPLTNWTIAQTGGPGNYVVNLTGCEFVPPLTERFDSVAAPALPAGWTAGGAGFNQDAVTQAFGASSQPNCVFLSDPEVSADRHLTSPTVRIPAGSNTLSFRHRFNLENTFDGGVLEISINAGAFQDIIEAGGSFALNGYNSVISTNSISSFSRRVCWSGALGVGYFRSIVNLPAAASGQNCQFRWRVAIDETVNNPGWSIDDVFVNPPEITDVNPRSGPAAGGTSITLTGTNLAGVSSVTVNGIPCTGVTVVNDTTITCVTPPGILGSQSPVVVTSPAGDNTPSQTTFWADAQTFTYVDATSPTVTNVAPPTGPTTAGTAITITGTNFVTGATVTVNGFAATTVNVVNATTITCFTPAGTKLTPVSVVVTQGIRRSAQNALFTYVPTAPAVTSVATSPGATTFSTRVSITGSRFFNVTGVTFNGNAATQIVANVAGTNISCVVPPGAAAAGTPVLVTTAFGTNATNTLWTYAAPTAPTVTARSPIHGVAGTTLWLQGTSLFGVTGITIGGVAATNIVESGTGRVVSCVVPAGTGTGLSVLVTTALGTNTANAFWTYLTPTAPTVTSVTPATGSIAGGTLAPGTQPPLLIAGNNFLGATSVTFGGVPALYFTVNSNVEIAAVTAPGVTVGAGQSVVVTTPNGSNSANALWTYTALATPTVTSVTPNAGLTTGGSAITITGTGFFAGATVTVGGVACTSVSVINAYTITCVTGSGMAVGTASVNVTTTAGVNGANTLFNVLQNNGAAVANPSTGSTFTGTANTGPFAYAVNPGATLVNGNIDLTDPESDTITVSAITPPGTVPTGITAPSIPTPGHPLTLSWTGTADATNAPGNYTWVVTFSDSVNGATVNVNITITINDLAPTHVAGADAASGNGQALATAYEGSAAQASTTMLTLADVDDPNVNQSLSQVSVTPDGGNPVGGSGFTVVFNGGAGSGTITATPIAPLVAADAGNHNFTVVVTDGTNNVTIFVRVVVSSNTPPTLQPSTGSSFVAGSDFDVTVAPGAALASANLDAADATPDPIDIVVTFVGGPMGPSTPPSGVTAPTGGTGLSTFPVVLSWTGTTNAADDPGVYTWEVTVDDGFTLISRDVNIIIDDVDPTHAAATGITGDGSGATPYGVQYAIGAAGSTNVSDLDDANLSQAITVSGTPTLTSFPAGSALVWNFATVGTNPATLTVTPAAVPALADVGDFDYTVNITDGTNVVSLFVTITVSGTAPTITSAAAPGTAPIGAAYSHQFTATGNPAPTFAVTTGTLPTWMTFVGGLLSGTPTITDLGVHNFTVSAQNGIAPDDTEAVSITVSGTAPTITSAAAPANAADGLPYSHQFTATGNPAPTFAVTTGTLPGWATLTPAGLLSGTAVLGQDINVTISAQNGIAPDDTEAVVVTVSAAVAPTITSALAPATATVGTLYTHTFTATGNPAPTFSATGLPAWLTLNPTSGLLTGTPAAGDVGTAGPIIVTATNGVNPDDTETFSIVVSSGGGGGGGDGGGDDGGGCSTDNSNYGWLALLGLLSVVAVVTRLRGSRS